MNTSEDFKNSPMFSNNTTKYNFYNSSSPNNYKLYCDLNNRVKFHSFNRRDYIIEANKIMKHRMENKNYDLLGLRKRTKNAFLSETKEICLNNYFIETIKNKMNSINLKELNYQQ